MFFRSNSNSNSANELDLTHAMDTVDCIIDQANPECASSFEERVAATFHELMAITNNPLATDAAYNVLSSGGSTYEAINNEPVCNSYRGDMAGGSPF